MVFPPNQGQIPQGQQQPSPMQGGGQEVTISADQLKTIENALVQLRESLDPATVPEEIMKVLLEAEQICSGILDKAEGGGAGKAAYGAMAEKGGPM